MFRPKQNRQRGSGALPLVANLLLISSKFTRSVSLQQKVYEQSHPENLSYPQVLKNVSKESGTR